MRGSSRTYLGRFGSVEVSRFREALTAFPDPLARIFDDRDHTIDE